MSYSPYVSEQNRKSRQFQSKYQSQGGKCAIRKNHLPIDKVTRDHIVPKFAGGYLGWDNIQLTCLECNRKKGKSFRPSWRDKVRLKQIQILFKAIDCCKMIIKYESSKLANYHGFKMP